MKYRCGNEQCFHGAFAKQSDAQEKARKVRGRVKFVHLGRGGWRYLVLTKKK